MPRRRHLAGGATQLVSYVRGRVAGKGIAHISFLRRGDPDTLAACRAGEVHSTGYDMQGQSITPLVG